jgi:protocadherin delta 1
MDRLMFGFVIIVNFLFIVLAQNELIDYNVLEELSPDTLIGNIPIDAKLNEKYDNSILRILHFSFLSQPSEEEALFNIEETTGIIRTIKKIDRDSLCPGQEICTLLVDVAVGPGQYFQIIPVHIEILDINDNSPMFSEDEVSKSISESSLVDSTYIPLPIPDDVDSPANGLHHYEIIPETSMFAIEEQQSLDGSIDLQLVLKQKLDREEVDFYQVYIIAYDSGDTPRSGSVLVNITVEDSNDNFPEFTQAEYMVQIPENIHPETTIITILANDADITSNGEVVYGFSSRTQNTYGDIFGIKPDTGDLYLKQTVDAEQTNLYSLVVTATDKGPNSRVVQAHVLVHVQDINDNRPQITVNTLTPDKKGQISEISTIGTFVAHASVIDMDHGENGNVTCFLNDTNFDVQKMYTKRYKIITNNMFDREEQESYVVQITCSDHGSPALRSVYDLTVNVLDVNDQSPLFTQTLYQATIPENSIVDTYVIQVNATDGDKGLNAEITYSLEQLKPGYLRIMPELGVIRTALNVDYEEIQMIEVKVIATDRGQPPNKGTSTVIITIEDRNDEPPAFIQEHYSFGIYENQDPGSEVGVVNAYDPDSELFSVTEFRIQADDQFVLSAFRIDKSSGQIITKLRLDRENISVYDLKVLAYNPGYDLTSTATVTMYVADDNDHAPEVDYPNSSNNTITISNLVPFGYVVTRIQAHDQDIGNNAQLIYALIQGNEDGLFDMDVTTGAITVIADLSGILNYTYSISVEIMDNGEDHRTVITMIHIAVDSTVPYYTHVGQEQGDTSDKSGSNSMIVIIVGCLSGAIIVALILAILAIRMQDARRKDQRYNCRMEAQKMLHCSTLDGSQSLVHKNPPAASTLYNPNSKYTIAGSDIVNNVRSNEGSSGNTSFLETGSLNNTGSVEGRGRPSCITQNSGQVRNAILQFCYNVMID